jgi:hypothetical protein
MKANRSIGPVKPQLKVPVSTLTTDHLSALEAFERWQRELPCSGAVNSAQNPTTDSDQPLEN